MAYTHGHGEKNEDAVVETLFLSCEDQTQLLSIALGITVTVHDYVCSANTSRSNTHIQGSDAWNPTDLSTHTQSLCNFHGRGLSL